MFELKKELKRKRVHVAVFIMAASLLIIRVIITRTEIVLRPDKRKNADQVR